MLCSPCHAVFTNYKDEDDHQSSVYHHGPEGFSGSSTNGCQLCQLRWSRLSPSEQTKLKDNDHQIEYLYFIENKRLRFLYYLTLEGRNHPYLQLVARLDFELIAQNDILTTPTFSAEVAALSDNGNSTSSPTTWALVKLWYERCLRDHHACAPGLKRAFVPTRLVDVGLGTEMAPCLRDGRSLPANAQYFSLSHCWGTSNRADVLQKHSLQLMQEAIPASAITKTFADAMKVVRYLGGRYLWIDSLCIIQDSREDWVMQSTQMHHIYSSAVCNISATAARDGSEGLFFHRSASVVAPLLVENPFHDESGTHHYCIDHDLWTRGIDRETLTKRAWVVQERFLSTRIIHFSRTQVFWECRETRACETFPTGIPLQVLRASSAILRSFNPKFEGALMRQERNLKLHPLLNVYQVWNSIVQAYTAATLTVNSDKLVAIGGLANRMCSYFMMLVGDENRYLAGIWEQYLADQLCWRPTGPGRRSERYIAPSWSWASWIGAVWDPCIIQEVKSTNILIEVIEAETTLIDHDPFGPVSQGFIRIRGSFILGFIWYESSRDSLDSRQGVKMDVYGPNSEAIDYMPEPDVADEGGLVYCVKVKTLALNDISGLLLKPVGSTRGQFQRVGTFMTRPYTHAGNAYTQYRPGAWKTDFPGYGWEVPSDLDNRKGQDYEFYII